MKSIYNLLMRLTGFLLPLGQLVGGKTKLFVKGQKNIDYRGLGDWRSQQMKVIWFHCASLGEFEQGRPVLEAFKEQNSDYKVLLTFFSPSGYEVRKNYQNADYISYLPLDTDKNAKKFVQAARPDIVVFVKYEFWPNILKEIKKSGALLIGISIILRSNQLFFKSYGTFFRQALRYFDFLFVQNETTARLLDSLDYQNYEVVGDTRFDRVIATASDQSEVEELKGFLETEPHKKVMVVGSAWADDMRVLTDMMKTSKDLKFIIAPHEINNEEIEEWAGILKALLFSKIDQFDGQRILIIDSIGLLSKIYKYADYAFVGGGFKTGLHNILEPAVFGIPIFFGDKKYHKFQEALDLIELGVAFAVNKSPEEIIMGLDTGLIRKKADEYVKKNAGATQKIVRFLEGKIN